jgi:Protein of unknown function (DUF3309)
MLLVVLIVLLILVLGGVPAWGLHQYGWGPSGVVGVVLVVLLILVLLGRI